MKYKGQENPTWLLAMMADILAPVVLRPRALYGREA